jgi:CDP-diacylglycerol pyrophosphatase
MITVTYPIRYSHQDFDEQQTLLSDLQANPKDYLNHSDGTVRSLADWCMESYKRRNLRPSIAADAQAGKVRLRALYKRLQYLTTHDAQP